ncbi:amidohydrolase family protein [Fulvivirga sedimenti]|uniref:Amidohydrolase family protein n=1 Tax=Fulvivirga sedimenti TaxID=2879465 RepID=A0A9X1KWM9_9BACT|nr:amidohydrolase family protein [Fulvivirga sedimenti]MCA6074906.1 amidohydrolase family protein [Fulvivirga sedimenti]MCA6076083.1 amidohydrolase family protein [Fulvivirga sedimenti]MCA6077211.1 amidohydrolase family protein [Fulvivirga sedimenti]
MKKPLLLVLTFLCASISYSQEKSDSIQKSNEDLPLEPGREFSISTNQGSWLSLDIHPDGTQVVFDFLGDLYLLPFSGGSAEQLTSGMQFDSQPRFSPDGKKVVFTSDKSGGENIWIIDLETREDKAVTNGNTNRYQSPEWSPDGQYILASKAGFRSGTLKLWMYHVDGGTGVELMSEPGNIKMTGAAFGNSDRFIWYAQREGDWQYNAIFPQFQIGRYDRQTGKNEVMSFREGSGIRPTPSPDGKWLVYGTRYEAQTGLIIRDLESGVERWLAYPVQRDDQESRGTRDALPGMSFTPDSKELVASYGGKIWRIPVSGGQAVEIPFSINTTIELGPELQFEYPIPDSSEFIVKQIRDAIPSPDGSKLAFTSLDRLYVMDLNEKIPRRLTNQEFIQAQPVWSPDGTWIAYTTWNDGVGHIYKTLISGKKAGQPVQLTRENAIYETPAWSPDGKRIVALRGPAVNFQKSLNQRAPGTGRELIWISADGGTATLIDYTYRREFPHFSRNPDRIYLNNNDGTLLSIRWDGSDEKKHVKVVGTTPPGSQSPLEASRIIIGHDESRAVAQVYNDMYLLTIPMVGGETQTINVSKGDKASFPVQKLSDIGGQFLAFSKDMTKVHWSIGNAHIIYDLDSAMQLKSMRETVATNFEEENKKLNKDTLQYSPEEFRIRVTAKRDLPAGKLLLTGARIITMNGDEIIENGWLLVENNRIKNVGPSGSFEVSGDTERMNVTGKTIIPGFVDTHAHVRPAWDIHKPEAWQFWANLAFGVTTVRDPQTSTTDILTYEDRVKAGKMLGPRIYSTGPGMFWQEQIENLDHARKLVSRYSSYYDTKTIKMYVAGNRQQRQWIIMACREQEIMPTTEGSLNFKQNLTQIIDGYPGHEHSFPIFPLYDDAIELIAFSNTAYTPTLLVAYGGPWAENYYYTRENPHDDQQLNYFTPHSEIDSKTRRRGAGTGPGPGGWFMDEEHVFKPLAAEVNSIVKAGGRAGVGSHGQLQGLGYHWELWSIQSGGMSAHEALKVATIMGAESIGLHQEVGSIEPGKQADLLILSKNPLENIRNTRGIEKVMMNGRLYDATTLDQVFPDKKSAPVRTWTEDMPGQVPGISGMEGHE